jgi:hypothetical protein
MMGAFCSPPKAGKTVVVLNSSFTQNTAIHFDCHVYPELRLIFSLDILSTCSEVNQYRA